MLYLSKKAIFIISVNKYLKKIQSPLQSCELAEGNFFFNRIFNDKEAAAN